MIDTTGQLYWSKSMFYPSVLFRLIFFCTTRSSPRHLYTVPDELLINDELANSPRFRVTAAFEPNTRHPSATTAFVLDGSGGNTSMNPHTTPAPGSHGNQRSAKKTWWVVNSGALRATFIIPFFSPPKTLLTAISAHPSGPAINLRFRVPSRTDSPAQTCLVPLSKYYVRINSNLYNTSTPSTTS